MGLEDQRQDPRKPRLVWENPEMPKKPEPFELLPDEDAFTFKEPAQGEENDSIPPSAA